MKDARATRELQAFEAIQTADNDEQCFYALCEYFYFISANNDLKELLKSHFRKSGNDLYLGAGKELFKLLEDEKQTPMAVWGNVMRTLTGGGNKSLIMFTKPGASLSVGRKVHSLLPEQKVLEKPRIVVHINKQLHLSVKGRENRPFYKPRKGQEPYKILQILVNNFVNKAAPVSSGSLSKQIYKSLTKTNQISSAIGILRKKQFKPHLGHEFISNNSGYFINDDVFDIEIE